MTSQVLLILWSRSLIVSKCSLWFLFASFNSYSNFQTFKSCAFLSSSFYFANLFNSFTYFSCSFYNLSLSFLAFILNVCLSIVLSIFNFISFAYANLSFFFNSFSNFLPVFSISSNAFAWSGSTVLWMREMFCSGTFIVFSFIIFTALFY